MLPARNVVIDVAEVVQDLNVGDNELRQNNQLDAVKRDLFELRITGILEEAFSECRFIETWVCSR